MAVKGINKLEVVGIIKYLLLFFLFTWLAWHRLRCFPTPQPNIPIKKKYTLKEAIRIHTEYQVLVDSLFISKDSNKKSLENKLDSIKRLHYDSK